MPNVDTRSFTRSKDSLPQNMNTSKWMDVFRKSLSYSCCFCILVLIFLTGGIVLASRMSWFLSSPTSFNQDLSENLLKMKYNEVVYAGTHNSYAVVGTILAANQFESIQKSLDSGIRALMLDVHFLDDTKLSIALCHADCSLGAVGVEETFDTIATFLEKHPVNIITIIWESTCEDEDDCTALKHMLYNSVEQSRLSKFLFTPTPENIWPTLQAMVQKNQKIVHFFDRGPFERPWDLKMWDWVIETPYDNKDKSDLDGVCTFNRGTPNNSEKLFLNNHFSLRGLVPVPASTLEYNINPYMYDRIIRCQRELGKTTTNFIVVDHWSYSNVIKTAACLNGEINEEFCQSEDRARILATVAISLIGGSIGLLVTYGLVRLYRKLSNGDESVPVALKVEALPLLHAVSMASDLNYKENAN
jgi:hypothetical protein